MMTRAQGPGWVQLLGQLREPGNGQGLDNLEPTGFVMPLVAGGSLQALAECVAL